MWKRRPVMYATDDDSSSEEEKTPSPPIVNRPMPASKKKELAERAKRLSLGSPGTSSQREHPEMNSSSLQSKPSQANHPSTQGKQSRMQISQLLQSSQDEDFVPTSQTQRNLSDAELERLASLVSNFFLCADNKKIPVKRADIAKIIPKEYSRKTAKIIDAASSQLEDVFGYKILELEKTGYYVMVNRLKTSLLDEKEQPLVKPSPREAAIDGFRTIVLSCIFMNGGVMHEASLREFLKNFEVDPDSREKHPIFGDVNKMIYQEFVRQCYLEVSVVKDVDPHYKEVRWGERAKLEMKKKEMIEFVCKVYGESVKPEMWTEQWKVVDNEIKLSLSAASQRPGLN